MMAYLLVFLGGGLGSVCRFALSQGLGAYKGFPVGTFTANALSCVLLGVLVGLASKELLSAEYRFFLIAGFCGGFSTFSTFSNEVFQLFKSGSWGMGCIYMMISLVMGLVGILAGLKAAAI